VEDRELLELAAKAAGMEIVVDDNGLVWRDGGSGSWPKWNPLTDDGDAFRLAVNLKLDVAFLGLVDEVFVESGSGDEMASAYVSYESDPLAATRRAIVLAAVEIGRVMP
jgi:hypothetical protein